MDKNKTEETMKRFTIIALAIICLIWVPAAQAGAARRHTIEGFMLGTGAAILGTIIYNGMNREPERVVRRHGPPTRHAPYRSCQKGSARPGGHWEMHRVWVNPVYQETWNPGHYNRRGRWIHGRQERFLVREGYWQERKIWVWN